MGSGKTAAGEALGEFTGRKFADMDSEIESGYTKSIVEIFEDEGEDEFRKAEAELLRKLSRKKYLIIATGGGVPANPENLKLMKRSGQIVFLDTDLNTCVSRITGAGHESRPKWGTDEEVSKLYQSRLPAYQPADHNIKTSGLSPHQTAIEIIKFVADLKEYSSHIDSKRCRIIPEFNAPQHLAELLNDKKFAILTDKTVEKTHLDKYTKTLNPALTITVPAGEKSKSLREAETIYSKLLESRLDRSDTLVAIGGGVITDLGGFVASTYKRGINYIPVSTSLVGCADAAIGGKTAVNLGGTKNVVGTFSIPDQVILDLTALKSLPVKLIRDGLIEAYKTGLVADPNLAAYISDNMRSLLKGDILSLSFVAHRSAVAKARIVEEDFREGNRRRILNYGHTFGHAMEGMKKYKASHGTSVGIGMLVATVISGSRGLLDKDESESINDTVLNLLKKSPLIPKLDDAWDVLLNDKKNVGGKIIFVLLEGIGKPVIVHNVSYNELNDAVNAVRGKTW
jgi:3-dehydroquinate synthase